MRESCLGLGNDDGPLSGISCLVVLKDDKGLLQHNESEGSKPATIGAGDEGKKAAGQDATAQLRLSQSPVTGSETKIHCQERRTEASVEGPTEA